MEYRYPTAQNNGQINQQKDWISGEEITYQYDSLSRLISAATTGPEWGLSFAHDGFGNRTNQTVTKGSAPSYALTINPGNNHSTSFNQDNNGNVTWMPPGLTMTHDVENRTMSAQGSFGTERYGYDLSNHRVYRKKADGTEEFTVWGAQGERVEVFKIVSGQAQTQTTNIYFAGRLMRTKNHTTGWETALTTDRLGSVAVRVNPSGINEKLRYYPYGEEYAATTNDRDKYATYLRDSSTGLDYAINRYYGSNLARFLSPDPLGGSANLGNPQSWNRYGYASNDPINKSDPFGLLDIDVNSCRAEVIFDGERIVVVGQRCELTPGGGDALFGNPEDTFFARALLQLEDARSYIYSHLNNSEKCAEDLAKLGTNLDELVSQVGEIVFGNGRTSFDVPYSSLFPGQAGASQEALNPGLSVGAFFAVRRGVRALSDINDKRTVYINPALIRGDNRKMGGLLLHEAVHQKTGKVDPDLQKALGYSEKEASEVVGLRLAKDCLK